MPQARIARQSAWWGFQLLRVVNKQTPLLSFKPRLQVCLVPTSTDNNGIVSVSSTFILMLLHIHADLTSNILEIPFRRSHPVSLSNAITQYISSKYDQRPDMFADDLMIIDRLRTEAVNVQEPHVSGISRLVTYAAQLKWLGGKFPIDVRGFP